MNRDLRNGIVLDDVYIDFDNMDSENVEDIIAALAAKGYECNVHIKEDAEDNEKLFTFKPVNVDMKGIGVFMADAVVKSVAVGYELLQMLVAGEAGIVLMHDGISEDIKSRMDISGDIFEATGQKDILIYELENVLRVRAYEIEKAGRYVGIKLLDNVV